MSAARTLLAALTVVALTAPAAQADVPTSAVEDLTVARSGNTLTVDGSAILADASAAVIGTDPEGDSHYRDVPLEGVGTDLVEASIEHVPASSELLFTFKIADPMPTTFTIPEVVHYHWLLEVTNGADSAVYLLQAMRSGQYDRPVPSPNPLFRVNACSLNSGGTPSCFNTLRYVDGTMADGIVRWRVPVATIGAFTGAVITPYRDGAVVKLGASGATYGSPGPDDIETLPYVVGPVVTLGIQSAETDPELMAHWTPTALGPDGTFTGKVKTPSIPGDYVVSARACHGDARGCATRDTIVTVP